MAPLASLHGGIGRDLDHRAWLNLGQRLDRVLASPPVGRDLVRPWMSSPRRAQYGAELGRLPGVERNATSDHDQVVATVAAGDHDLGSIDRAEDSADDHFLSGAVLHRSSGSSLVSCIVALGWLIGWRATRAPWWDDSAFTNIRSDRLFNRCRTRVDFEDLPADAGLVEQFGESASNVIASNLAVKLCRTEGHGADSGTVEK